jgi:hypothetical protein
MLLDIAPELSQVVFQLPSESAESIAEGDVNILRGMICGRGPADDQLATWNRQLDSDMEKIPLMMVAVGLFDHHLAAGDACEALFQFPYMFFNVFCDRLRAVEVTKLNLQRRLHGSAEIPEQGKWGWR